MGCVCGGDKDAAPPPRAPKDPVSKKELTATSASRGSASRSQGIPTSTSANSKVKYAFDGSFQASIGLSEKDILAYKSKQSSSHSHSGNSDLSPTAKAALIRRSSFEDAFGKPIGAGGREDSPSVESNTSSSMSFAVQTPVVPVCGSGATIDASKVRDKTSPHELYEGVCKEFGWPMSTAVRLQLSGQSGQLDHIHLRNCNVTDMVMRCLAYTVRYMPLLKDLRVNSCNVTDAGLSWMVAEFLTHPALETINFSGNMAITDRSMRGILAVARSNARVTAIQLDNTGVSARALKRLAKAMGERQPAKKMGSDNLEASPLSMGESFMMSEETPAPEPDPEGSQDSHPAPLQLPPIPVPKLQLPVPVPADVPSPNKTPMGLLHNKNKAS